MLMRRANFEEGGGNAASRGVTPFRVFVDDALVGRRAVMICPEETDYNTEGSQVEAPTQVDQAQKF